MRGKSSAIAMIAVLACAGCKVVSIEEDRARKSASAGAESGMRYTAAFWRSNIMPELRKRAVPIDRYLAVGRENLAAFGQAHGHRTGEGSPWTFVLQGEAKVVAVDRESRRGTLDLRLLAEDEAVPAILQMGPVVSGTAIRDSLDFISFNDFADQLQYAAVGNALTEYALSNTTPALEAATTGSTVRFIAAAPVLQPEEPLILTPIVVELVQ